MPIRTLASRRAVAPAAASFALLALLAACGGGDDEPSGPRDVAIEFAAVAGTTPVSCGSPVTALGAGNVTAQVKDFRFYVSNVRLMRADGTEAALTLPANDDWNLTSGANAVTLIDLENNTGSCAGTGTTAMNSTLRGTVPAGSYTGVRFTVGVPFALNHSDYAAATKPLDIQAMAWSWQAGRKFVKIELTDPDGAAGSWTAKTFNLHLGSTGCTGNPAAGETVACAKANRMEVSLASFNPASQKLAVDVRAMAAGTDITVNAAGAPGCMSGPTDPECLRVFESLGIDWKADGTGTGLSLAGGSAQTLIRAVAK
jgi:uncharacterized repeat protein (TIGR04052 family)